MAAGGFEPGDYRRNSVVLVFDNRIEVEGKPTEDLVRTVTLRYEHGGNFIVSDNATDGYFLLPYPKAKLEK